MSESNNYRRSKCSIWKPNCWWPWSCYWQQTAPTSQTLGPPRTCSRGGKRGGKSVGEMKRAPSSQVIDLTGIFGLSSSWRGRHANLALTQGFQNEQRVSYPQRAPESARDASGRCDFTPIQAVDHSALKWVQLGYLMRQRLSWAQKLMGAIGCNIGSDDPSRIPPNYARDPHAHLRHRRVQRRMACSGHPGA